MKHLTLSLTVILSVLLLQGCAPLIIGGAVAGGAAVAHDRRTVGTMIDDESIEMKVKSNFYSDTTIRNNTHINVTSFNGVVLLTGEAPSHELRDQVARVANATEKVRTVHNEVTIAAPSAMGSRSSDSMITMQVKTELLQHGSDHQVDGTQVKVVTENGTVYMMGLVSREEGQGAVEIARNVGGVQRVVKVFEYTN